MTHAKPLLAAAVAAALASAGPSMAEGSASSASSAGSSASLGSVSTSLGASSNSSQNKATAANGDYRIVDIAAAPDRPGSVRLTLQGAADAGADSEFYLYLPQTVADQARLVEGGTVSARQRPYGIEFATGQERQAFFLVLADDWYRELQARAVQL
jgi:hypothetical protein